MAVGAGLGLSRWIGVDDAVSGIWIGGLILSSSLWFYSWLSKKYPKLHTTPYMLLTTTLIYILSLIPLVWTGVLIYKLVIGIVIGSLTFLLGIWADKKVRKIKGKQLFNFQKVVFPVASLLISSIIVWIITKH
ncbi:hypothetical protein COX03_02410 [Candidatus Woesebacteria bacterium CG22_combo_CG10-13_8_21_14_all_39_10]|uniref:Uncharacterized protein n=1 Tax=Candidatus Woesebacteria bacterium CG22_combo_CG10-13_8_21_14_all_39_10 TaxID=1975059 RepID=A0A2H0BIR5_9BACT|nr:MAG: hypothetical protein COX03_02410 [Candidatus Woesebacteria bacterium CG22_combo_CG10-13_8_21_14_all_39_10]